MASPSGFNSPLVYNARREQMYFPLAPEEIERLRRFGEVRRFAPGDYLVHAGETGLGMTVILEGRVNVTRRDGLGHDEPVVSYRPGHFIAEVGQLSGRAAFVDARALGEVEALVIPPTGLRALVIAEAELGERVMRALILRRVGLIQTGAGGPVLVGPPDHPGVVRLQSVLARNGIPYRVMDPATEHEADGLLACIGPTRGDLPLVLCPDGSVLRGPSERELAERIGLPAPLTDQAYYSASAGDLTVRWSLHTEFARYTFIVGGDCADPFERTALDRIPAAWLRDLPGVVLVALHAVLLPSERETELAEMSSRWFGGRELIGAEIGDGNGAAYTDLRLHPDARLAEGFSRYVVVDRAMGASQSGRMLQRLFELETYRMLTLLALPIAKKQMRDLDNLGIELRAITERMAAAEGNGSDAQLLSQLTALATRVEQLIAESQYRFSAAHA